MTILLADHDPGARQLLERTLQRLGHEVVSVADGTEARDALLDPSGPRLAILDWMMPGLDGLAVCRAVRQRKAPYVYLILLTPPDTDRDVLAGLAAEADDCLTKPLDTRALTARIQSGERIVDFQTGLLTTATALRREATHDRLTGLWNRGMVLDYLEREIGRVQRSGEPLTIALADIDQFKRINDTYGHDSGDQVLQETARRMQSALRGVDGVGRYGGEEFLLVLESTDSVGQVDALDRVRLAVSDTPIDISRGRINVTLSVGAAHFHDDGSDLASIISAADQALYRAKAKGRNRIEVSRPARPLFLPAPPSRAVFYQSRHAPSASRKQVLATAGMLQDRRGRGAPSPT